MGTAMAMFVEYIMAATRPVTKPRRMANAVIACSNATVHSGLSGIGAVPDALAAMLRLLKVLSRYYSIMPSAVTRKAAQAKSASG